jgi:hypothetical protein
VSRAPHEPPARATGAEALLRSVRSDHAPSSADRERVRRALTRRLEDAPRDAASAASTRSVRAWLSGAGKVGIGVAVVAVGLHSLLQPGAAPAVRLPSDQPPPLVASQQPMAADTHALHVAPESTDSAPSQDSASGRRSARAKSANRPARTPGVEVAPARAESARAPRALPADAERSATAPDRSRAAAAHGDGSQARSSAAAPGSPRVGDGNDRGAAAPVSPGVSDSAGARIRAAAPVSPGVGDGISDNAQARASAEAAVSPDVHDSVGARVSAAARTARPQGAADGRAELVLLQRIRSALEAREPEHVLRLCSEHAQRWPRGTFTQERIALQVIASCQLRRPQADRSARSFFVSYPQSPMTARVRDACALQLKAAIEGR